MSEVLGAVEGDEIRAEEPVGGGHLLGTRRRTVTRRQLLVLALQLAVIVVLVGLWQQMGSGSKTLYLTVSTPLDVLRWISSWATGGSIPHGNGWSDLAITARTAAYGYLLGAGSGVVVGSIVGGSELLRRFAAPFVAMMNAFPKIALAPLFVVIFGASAAMQVYFVSAGVFFITFFAMFHGLQTIDVVYLRNAKMLGASLLWRARVVYLPSTFGWLISGLRLTATWSVAATVVVEYLTSGQGGMGLVVSSAQAADNVPQVVGGIIVVSVFALVIDRGLVRLNRRAMRWRAQ